MEKCSLDPQDCIERHLMPVKLLGLQPTGNGRWSGFCPNHRDTKRSLTLLPNQRYGFWPECHRDPPCKRREIRDAMVRLGIAQTCLPRWGQKQVPEEEDTGLVLLARELIDKKASAAEWRLRMTMHLDGVDAPTAAKTLKLPDRTYYNVRPKSA